MVQVLKVWRRFFLFDKRWWNGWGGRPDDSKYYPLMGKYDFCFWCSHCHQYVYGLGLEVLACPTCGYLPLYANYPLIYPSHQGKKDQSVEEEKC